MIRVIKAWRAVTDKNPLLGFLWLITFLSTLVAYFAVMILMLQVSLLFWLVIPLEVAFDILLIKALLEAAEE